MKKIPEIANDGLSFECEICQDRGCQNCQGEYQGENDPVLWQNNTSPVEKKKNKEDNQSLPLKIEDDGLSFDCEYCGDAPGGCPQCGFGRNRK